MPEPKSPVEQQLNRIERTLEVHSVRMDAIDQKLDRIADLVEANTAQVATLSEGLTRLENIVERGFDRLEVLITQQQETAQMQARHVERLMGVVETLLAKVA